MCGIGMLWCKEARPDYWIIDALFKWAERRGIDGTGFAVIRDKEVLCEYKSAQKYSDCKEEVKFFMPQLNINDVIMLIGRAAPETEPSTSEVNMQPIVNSDCVLIHNGAVSQKVLGELRDWANVSKKFKFETSIDSEAIIAEYVRCQRNIKETQENLTGGFSYVLYDLKKNQVYLVNDFKPISTGYIKGLGYFVTSESGCITEIIEIMTSCKQNGIAVWENFYGGNTQSANTIRTVDIESGFETQQKFRPRYLTNTWDSKTKSKGDMCLVSCSGGIDSSLTLATLKYSGFENITAVHFKYGHRGQDSELSAITSVCNILKVKLVVVDISNFYSSFADTSMLLDEKKEVRTGTPIALKTVEAWVPGRNFMFLTHMATIAEAEVMRYNYDKVYMLGGMMQLSESGFYPDNSEDFIRNFLTTCKYGTLIGDRFHIMYGLSNLMKSEQWILIKAMCLEDIIRHTISCDRPKMIDGIPHNCSKNGIPACGSGLLSWWGSKMIGMDDMKIRSFYEIDEDYVSHIPEHLKDSVLKECDIESIIDRILIPEQNKQILRKFIINDRKK